MKLVPFIFMIGFLVSCSGSKKVREITDHSNKTYSLDKALSLHQKQTINYKTLEAKIKCKYEDEKTNLSFKTTVRVEHDKRIWVSGGMFGLEGVRALITPDTVKVINRLQGEYYVEPVSKLEEITGLPVDFELMQQLLAGQILFVNNKNAAIERKEGFYEIVSQLNQLVSIAWLDDYNLVLDRQTLIDESKSRQMDISYHNYEPVGDFLFPFESLIQVNGDDKKLWLDLEFTKIELNNQLSFPFMISKGYERKML